MRPIFLLLSFDGILSLICQMYMFNFRNIFKHTLEELYSYIYTPSSVSL